MYACMYAYIYPRIYTYIYTLSGYIYIYMYIICCMCYHADARWRCASVYAYTHARAHTCMQARMHACAWRLTYSMCEHTRALYIHTLSHVQAYSMFELTRALHNAHFHTRRRTRGDEACAHGRCDERTLFSGARVRGQGPADISRY